MPYDFKNASVLIVEDMPPIVELLRQILHTFGFKDVLIAKDTEHAFNIICQHEPDLILTDWVLPGGNGLELTKKIRTDNQSPTPFVPIIMISGFCSKKHVEMARDAGVNEFLTKPFTSQDLYSRISQVIENPRDFVKTKHFFGPDRRRHMSINYDGDKKRDQDDVGDVFEIDFSDDATDLYGGSEPQDILSRLRQETKDLLPES